MDTIKPSEKTPQCHYRNSDRNLIVCDADLSDIIPNYLARKRVECTELRELAQKGDFAAIRDTAHGIKGSGGCYGFSVISEIGGVMESAAKVGNQHDVLIQVELLINYLDCIEVEYE